MGGAVMWFWIWLVTFVSGGGLIQVLDSERRRLADRLREWTDTATSQQELIRRRDAQIESLEMTIKELQVQIGNRDQSFKKLQEKLSEVYTELHNLRDAAIRREAVIHIASEAEKVDTARLKERLAGAERQLGIQRMSAKSLVEVKTNLEKQLSAAKALLAGVKIGVGELLIVQPDGDCTDADVNALRREMGPIDGKVVVVRHVNAWRAVPIPRDIATKVEEPQEVDPSEFIDGPYAPQFDEQRLLLSQELAQVKRDRETLEEELASIRHQLDQARSSREAIAVELTCLKKRSEEDLESFLEAKRLYETVKSGFASDLRKLNVELEQYRKIIDANTFIEANDDDFERRKTDPSQWNDITISLSSRLIHGSKRAQPAATVMNRDTSPSGPTSGHLQALADLLIQTLERKYPKLATWGAKEAVEA
jgi:uncharacterized coiled-coil protein SlyX